MESLSPNSSRTPLQQQQLAALRALVAAVREGNRFYQTKLAQAELSADIDSIDQYMRSMPWTTKDELVSDQRNHPPYGSNLTQPLENYSRLCQTSGTTGQPFRVIDTTESWQVMLDCWKRIYQCAGMTAHDRVFYAFSFGPFLGFWTAFEAALQMRILAIPGGGMSTANRLQLILDNDVTAICCTPTYAIRLAQVAKDSGVDLSRSCVRRIIVAGEPGGSIPHTRRLIENLWANDVGCRVVDHHGMTEVGPVSYENPNHPGILHIMEDTFLAEVIDPQTSQPVAPGELGELVLTTLKRTAWPLLRYRTGDLVRVCTQSAQALGDENLALKGGILGRADDMVVVRGVNIYPSAIDRIIRQFAEVVEYQVRITTVRGMNEMQLRIEPSPAMADSSCTDELCRRVAAALRDALQLRIDVVAVQPDALPRFEMKAQRWIRP